MSPLLILLVGMATILGAIIVLRVNAFLALIGAAIVVSLLAPGEATARIGRVAEGFGRTAGTIGIVIALAAIIGSAMMETGAADRIVHAFLTLLGERRGGAALAASGWVLSIPVFFDTVFYLLVPLARSMRARTGREYLKYLVAIAAGAVATHNLVPPTPGPLAVTGALGVDLGTMILMGILVSLPAAGAGLWFAGWIDRRMPVANPGDAPGASAAHASEGRVLPGLALSLLPIVLPVLLISSNTLATAFTPAQAGGGWSALRDWAAILGNPNLALLLSAAIAIGLYARHCGAGQEAIAAMIERSLMGAGIIILITAAGGAFGAALQAARLGPAIESAVARWGAVPGVFFLFLAFGVASLVKIAQGSSTVAMITTAGILGAMLRETTLPFHVVYVATATSAGAMVAPWMNDSAFWVFSKLGGVTEVQTLKSWTPVSAIVGVTAMLVTLALALLVPLR